MYDEEFEKFRDECLAFNHNQNCKLIEEWSKEAGVESPIGYYNELGKHRMTIYTDRPGYLVGKGGCLVDKFKKKLCEEFYADKYEVKFVEIRGGFANVLKENE